MTSIESLHEWCMSMLEHGARLNVSQIHPFPYNTLNFNYPLFNIIYVLLNFHASNGIGGVKKTWKIAFESATGWWSDGWFQWKMANSSVLRNAIWQFFKTFIRCSTYLIHVISPLFVRHYLPTSKSIEFGFDRVCSSLEFV